jgi:glycosyltransferase involved in cell wall biosynthesis
MVQMSQIKPKLKSLQPKVSCRLLRSKKGEDINTIAVCAAQVPFFQGGAETHVNSLVDKLKESGYEVDLINIPYKWYPRQQLLDSIDMWKKVDLVESNGKKIDMVISTKFPSYFVEHPNKVLWLTHQYRQIYDLFHTSYSGFDPSNKRDVKFRERLIALDTKAIKSYQRRYTISKNTADRLKKFNRIDSIPLYPPPQMTGRYFTSEYKDYLLSVGRLDKLKRVDFLLKVLAQADARIQCKIAGTGPEFSRLQDMAQDLGLTDRVEFLGFVPEDELLRLYAECSCVFFAPLDEDYGYITLEAFLSRKPVITGFDSGGPLEFVEDQRTGIVLDSFAEKDMAVRIEELFFDKQKCEDFGTEGYRRVKDINWNHVIDSLVGRAKS